VFGRFEGFELLTAAADFIDLQHESGAYRQVDWTSNACISRLVHSSHAIFASDIAARADDLLNNGQ
jgi:hypothetical protein